MEPIADLAVVHIQVVGIATPLPNPFNLIFPALWEIHYKIPPLNAWEVVTHDMALQKFRIGRWWWW